MIDIERGITNYCEKVYPGYSKTSKYLYKDNFSLYAQIYHGLIFHHNGNSKKSNYILKKCLEYLKKNKFVFNQEKNDAHSSFYRNLHLAALLAQFACSVSGNFSNIELIVDRLFNEETKAIIYNPRKFISHIKSLKFKSSWHDSNIIMSLFSLRFATLHGDINDEGFKKLILLLKNLQNKKNGLWLSKNNFGGLLNAMAATYHYIPIFMVMGEKIPHYKKIINSTNSLHLSNGHFSAPNGHSCIDMDAFFLYYLFFKDNKSHNFFMEFKYHSIKFIDHLKYIKNSDNGFCDFPNSTIRTDILKSPFFILRNLVINKCYQSFLWNIKGMIRCLPIIRSSVKIVSNSDKYCFSYLQESNVFSCWFKLLTLEVANQGKQCKIEKDVIKQKRIYKLPFIGYGL